MRIIDHNRRTRVSHPHTYPLTDRLLDLACSLIEAYDRRKAARRPLSRRLSHAMELARAEWHEEQAASIRARL